HAGVRRGDGLSLAGCRAARDGHHRARLRPHALQYALRHRLPLAPGRLVLRRLDGWPGVRPLRQLRLRLGRADRYRPYRLHAAVADGRAAAARTEGPRAGFRLISALAGRPTVMGGGSSNAPARTVTISGFTSRWL